MKQEKVGKVNLDLTHYPGEDFYCDGLVEDEILEIVKTYSEVEKELAGDVSSVRSEREHRKLASP